jgi:hypothetical protein
VQALVLSEAVAPPYRPGGTVKHVTQYGGRSSPLDELRVSLIVDLRKLVLGFAEADCHVLSQPATLLTEPSS